MKNKSLCIIVAAALSVSMFASVFATQSSTGSQSSNIAQTTTSVQSNKVQKATAKQKSAIAAFYKKQGWNVSKMTFQKVSKSNAFPKKADLNAYKTLSKKVKLSGSENANFYVGSAKMTHKKLKKTYEMRFYCALDSKNKVIGACIEGVPTVPTANKVLFAANSRRTAIESKLEKHMTNITEPVDTNYDIKGSIDSITKNKNNTTTIIITNGDNYNSKYGQASITINSDTVITVQGQLTMDLKPVEMLKVKDIVEIKFTGPVAESYPVQATAGRIVIVASIQVEPIAAEYDIKGTVASIEKRGDYAAILITDGNRYDSAYTSATIEITDSTAITVLGQLTRELKTVNDLAVGTLVQVTFTGPATKSNPARATAASIQIVENNSDNNLYGSIINFNFADMTFNLQDNEHKSPLGLANALIRFNDDTVIVSQKSPTKKLTMNDLKNGLSAQVEISPAVALSEPPQVVATKITLLDK